jgi:hypothetical protein
MLFQCAASMISCSFQLIYSSKESALKTEIIIRGEILYGEYYGY